MKTAISIPDLLFELAEQLAKQLEISRSELYARTLADFIKEHSDDEITTLLNDIYAEEDSVVEPVLWKMASTSLPREDW